MPRNTSTTSTTATSASVPGGPLGQVRRISHTEQDCGYLGVAAVLGPDTRDLWWVLVDGDTGVPALRPYRSRRSANAAYRRYVITLAAKAVTRAATDDPDVTDTLIWAHTDVQHPTVAGVPCVPGCPHRPVDVSVATVAE